MTETDQTIEIKDVRNKAFFLLDDAFVDTAMARCGPTATLVYIALCRHGNKERMSWPSIALLIKETALSRRTIIYAIAKLQLFHMIDVVKRVGQQNQYIILDKKTWTFTLSKPTSAPDAPVHQMHQCTRCTSAPDARGGAPDARGGAPDAPVIHYMCFKETHKGNTRREQNTNVACDYNACPKRLAFLLITKIRQNNPRNRLGSLSEAQCIEKAEHWAKDIDLLLRRDHQEPAVVVETIEWATIDNFWGSNILSGQALRKHWDKLVGNMKREEMKKQQNQPTQGSRKTAGNWRLLQEARITHERQFGGNV